MVWIESNVLLLSEIDLQIVILFHLLQVVVPADHNLFAQEGKS